MPKEWPRDAVVLASGKGRSMSLSSVAAVERYLNALKQKNLAEVPFAPDVVFEGPLSPKLTGAEAVKEFLNGILGIGF